MDDNIYHYINHYRVLESMLWQAAVDEINSLSLKRLGKKAKLELITLRTLELLHAKMINKNVKS
jgi:hypothetical protein